MAVSPLTANGFACNSKIIPRLPPESSGPNRKGKFFLPNTVVTNLKSRSKTMEDP